MSADGLHAASVAMLEAAAADCANAMIGTDISMSCEQIALRQAYLKGQATAYQAAFSIVTDEYRKLMMPEQTPVKTKAKEIY